MGTVPGQEERTKSAKSPDMARAAHNLLRYSPDSPMGRGALIETNWAEAEPHVADWEKDHGGDAFVLTQLGFHWLEEGRLDQAAAPLRGGPGAFARWLDLQGTRRDLSQGRPDR